MNKAKLKSYAPQARLDFIAAVIARANLLGLSAKSGQLDVAPAQTQGDVTVIAGQAWPSKVSGQRERLIDRMKRDGFEQTCEAIAYTWFNRFAALRYMELHDYLGHGHRALSSASGGLPDILTYAADLANAGGSGLPGLKSEVVTEMKLAGNRDGELYRMLLVAQCNALSRAMPFLFERIDDDSELLLPDNLLRSDSVIAKLVEEIPEEDWAEVEIIGWLYQFYISEKKDQVIGKVVKSEDIPAATQLFTPNWIVQYLVQNSVGRLWLMANPQSTLAKEWPYYITPAEQTPEVQAQLDALIQTRVREDGDTLNPESITVLDPACGSGHILVVAYDVLKAIYLERGYQPRAIPRLILEKNLFGLDIDDRAAQMAGFALIMKARADDRRLFSVTDDSGNLQSPKLNVLSLQESKGLNVEELATHLAPFKVQRATIAALKETFEHAKTFGSLIQIPYALKTHLAELREMLALVKLSGDMYASAAADDLLPLVHQAKILEMQFDAVVANPPYMGNGGMNEFLKKFVGLYYKDAKSDLMTCFMERCLALATNGGHVAMINLPSWLFLGAFERFRYRLLHEVSIQSLIHLGRGMFGSDFGSVAFVLRTSISEGNGVYRRLFVRQSEVVAVEELEKRFLDVEYGRHLGQQHEFLELPGNPIAYWISSAMRRTFLKFVALEKIADSRIGMATGKNEKYIRCWHEVSTEKINFSCSSRSDAKLSGKKWFPHAKGGEFRRWYGNSEYVVNWFNDGYELQNTKHPSGERIWAHNFNLEQIFKPTICWTTVTIADTGFRFYPQGYLFDAAAGLCQPKSKAESNLILGALNSPVARNIIRFLNPTVNLAPGYLGRIPIPRQVGESADPWVSRCLELSKEDWDSYETSWDFLSLLLLHQEYQGKTLDQSYRKLSLRWKEMTLEMQRAEKNNNDIFINGYGLKDELASDVPLSEISLTCNAHYRYGDEKSEEELANLQRSDTMREFISYAIGCMMGRYSLDEPGLIYANAGNVGFEPDRYATFPADADGIVPITDELWFEDDAVLRIREFLLTVWGEDNLEENLAWLAQSLGSKATETPEETIRRYVADKFFKDHLQTYKKRPIYWLFSSGKQGAFQALVYLHRYHEGTLSRMRAEYVVPLTSKIQSRIEMLQKDMASASSTAARNKLTKEVEKLKKKYVELLAYDEQLRHYADMRIKLDLDDGVKVNYGKFGDLLAEVKAITRGASDD